jgi:hypothetical protein
MKYTYELPLDQEYWWINQPYDDRIMKAVLQVERFITVPAPREPSYMWWYAVGMARIEQDTQVALRNIAERYYRARKELNLDHVY